VTAAAIIETGTLLKVVLISLAAGSGIAILFGVAVTGSSALVETLRARRRWAAAAWAAVTALCVAGSIGAVVLAIVVMASKR
jgi:hypothetical protein